MRWNALGIMLVLALIAPSGCTQKCYVPECQLEKFQGLPPANDCIPANCQYPARTANSEAPPTVLDPGRDPRYITLLECISMALENGSVGRQSLVTGAGGDPYFDQGLNFNRGFVSGSTAIRVLALDPAILATDIEASLAKFDARWRTSVTWDNTDQPVGTPLETFQANQTQVDAINNQAARFSTGLIKPLPSGGMTGITFSTDYELSNLDPRVNPSYRPVLAFQFQQPLLRGFGVDINQLLTGHPNGAPGTGLQIAGLSKQVEGILITRLNFDQQRIEFEKQVQIMTANIEEAYWNLYSAYARLYSREQGLRQAYEAWKINLTRYQAGTRPIQDLAQSRGQYESFRGQRLAALGDARGERGVLERERQLRALLGLPAEDGTRLVPIDAPTVAAFKPDWRTCLQEAFELRPDLMLARNDVKQKQLVLIRDKNLLLPDLRFISSYDFNAIGPRLDGNDNRNALRNLADFNFSNWQLGLQAEIPIGLRNEAAAVRASRLDLARSMAVLRDQEHKVELYLRLTYGNISYYYEQIQIQRAQREAYGVQLDARFKEFLAGRGTLDFLLEAQRNWADALAAEYDAIAQYNIAIMGLEFAKGTILNYNNVQVAEGALPRCAQVRAVEHERERARAIVCKERAAPVRLDELTYEGKEIQGLPKLPNQPPTLPALQEGSGPPPNEAKPLPPISQLMEIGQPGQPPVDLQNRQYQQPMELRLTEQQ